MARTVRTPVAIDVTQAFLTAPQPPPQQWLEVPSRAAILRNRRRWRNIIAPLERIIKFHYFGNAFTEYVQLFRGSRSTEQQTQTEPQGTVDAIVQTAPLDTLDVAVQTEEASRGYVIASNIWIFFATLAGWLFRAFLWVINDRTGRRHLMHIILITGRSYLPLLLLAYQNFPEPFLNLLDSIWQALYEVGRA